MKNILIKSLTVNLLKYSKMKINFRNQVYKAMKVIGFIFLVFLYNCSSDELRKDEECDCNKLIDLEIKSINPLPKSFHIHTANLIEKKGAKALMFDIEQSRIVDYYNQTLRTIYTPIYSESKSNTSNFHVYFEKEGLVSDFDMIISEEIIDENISRYSYFGDMGQLMVSFDILIETGQILDFKLGRTKGFGDRFNNCLEWTFNQMSTMDYLACMAVGPICAGTIASMCAVGASQDNFQTPDGP